MSGATPWLNSMCVLILFVFCLKSAQLMVVMMHISEQTIHCTSVRVERQPYFLFASPFHMMWVFVNPEEGAPFSICHKGALWASKWPGLPLQSPVVMKRRQK